MQPLLASEKISPFNKVRLVLLYALRYEKLPNNEVPRMIDTLSAKGIPSNMISVGFFPPLLSFLTRS